MGAPTRTRRLFFALWPDDELRAQIAASARTVLAERRARAIPAVNLHVTLAFLGSVAEESVRDVIEAANEVQAEPFELTLDRVESFRPAQVAWLRVAEIPPALEMLVQRLRLALAARQIEVDDKPFKPHVTIARNWRDRRLNQRIGPFAWAVRAFVLVESKTGEQGSEYRILQTWPLADAAGGVHGPLESSSSPGNERREPAPRCRPERTFKDRG